MANYLLEKSNESIKASQKLLSKQSPLPNASVHCSYYACYQLLNYIVSEKYQLDKKDLKKELDAIQKESTEYLESHVLFLHFCTKKFTESCKTGEKCDGSMANTLYIILNKLRTHRLEADYDSVYLSDLNKGKSIYTMANGIISQLKTIFNITL